MKTNKLYFVGIKGTGMAALAHMMHSKGYEVMGCDISKHFFTQDDLIEKNIPIYSFEEPNLPTEDVTFIIGNAFQHDFPVVRDVLKSIHPHYFYHEYLGLVFKEYRGIAVSGSHGKTTTTTMLRDMLQVNKPTAYVIGDGNGYADEKSKYMVIEACEFREHFLAYYPKISIMTNFEMDHVDYFKNQENYLHAYEKFANNTSELIIAWGDDEFFDEINFQNKTVRTYGFSKNNDYSAEIIQEGADGTVFDFYIDGNKAYRFTLPIVGEHMVLNALAVIAVGINESIRLESIEAGLQTFKGAPRRFQIEIGEENIYIDDYAHHPTEIEVTLKAARTRYPDKKIVAVFKPNRVSRLYHFVNEFKESLSYADEVFLMPFTSIDDYEGDVIVEVDYLADRIEGSYVIDENNPADVELLASVSPAVYVFMSSKDVYAIKEPLKNSFND